VLGRLPEQYFTRILAAAAAARQAPGPPYIDLGRGNPDLPPPAVALKALRAAALDTATPGVHGYPPFAGLPELKEAIAERYAADHGVALDPEREVAVLPGTKTGIMLAALACAEAGSAVLLPDPGYPDYHSGVALAGGRVESLPLEPSAGWQPDFEAVPAALDPSLVVLNYPSNPCAVAAADGTFAAAVAFARARGAWLLHDLAYDFLGFARANRSVLSEPGARELAVELWSPSKQYGMAGWRIGFAVGCGELVGRIQTLLDHLTAGVWVGLQRGLLAALTGDQGHVTQRREVYRARRDRLVGALRTAGAELATPEGTFYAWWRLPEGLTPERLVAEARLGVAAGEGFGTRGAGWARLSLAVPDATLDAAVARLGEVLKQG
jgi:aminotransferase